MPRLSLESRRRVLVLHSQGYSIQSIVDRLLEEDVSVTRQSLYKLIIKYRQYKTYVDLPRRAATRKLTAEMLRTVDQQLHENDELTATQLRTFLRSKFPSMEEVSSSTIKRARKELGWTSTRPHYCQLIRHVR